MNIKLPFEDSLEKQMNDLRLPNEDESWQKMKKLLDESKSRKPFAFFKTFNLVILIVLLAGGSWFFLVPLKTIKEKTLFTTTSPLNKMKPEKRMVEEGEVNSNQKPKIIKQHAVDQYTSNQPNSRKDSAQKIPFITSNFTKSGQQKKYPYKDRKVNHVLVGNLLRPVRSKQTLQGNFIATTNPNTAEAKNNIAPSPNNTPDKLEAKLILGKKEIVDSSANIEIVQSSGPTIPEKNSVINKEAIDTIHAATDKNSGLKKNGKFFLSGGVGIQQQLPLAGQKVVSYGYNGTNNAFSDYIPSVFVRLEKDQQWFLQGEFVYGAPQLVKEFPYSRQTQANYVNATVTTTTLRLQKTFYNAVPVSFNYYLRHNWSVGIGGEFSWLNGAIAEKEILTNNPQTQAQLIVKQIVPIKSFTDSFLYRTHLNLLLQTDYNWHRFSLSLRYGKDVQPYIKYTLPDGTINDEKNWSLEFILRWRLFKSSKFSGSR